MNSRTSEAPKLSRPQEQPSLGTQRKVDEGHTDAAPPLKKLKVEPALKNFLGIGAQKAKASRNARKKALVGFNNRVRAEKLTHTGSGIPLTQVVRFKYQKGFTQAVRTACQMEDLL
jgi:chromosome transmission fidelity protein 18